MDDKEEWGGQDHVEDDLSDDEKNDFRCICSLCRVSVFTIFGTRFNLPVDEASKCLLQYYQDLRRMPTTLRQLLLWLYDGVTSVRILKINR